MEVHASAEIFGIYKATQETPTETIEIDDELDGDEMVKK